MRAVAVRAIPVFLSLLSVFLFCLPATATPPAYTEAELIALEYSGELLPPAHLTQRIEGDVAVIRAYDPYLERVHAWPDWQPGVLLVNLMGWAWEQFHAGEYHGLDELNEIYGPVEIIPYPDLFLLLHFPLPYHPVVLASIYRTAPGVRYAEPNSIGGDNNDITCLDPGRYRFRRAWGDCPAGCMYQHVWVFSVEGGMVTLLEEYGDPVPDPPLVPLALTTWGRVKSLYRR